MNRKYIFWDNDGVLVDTEKFFYEAIRRAFLKFNIEISQELFIEKMVIGDVTKRLAFMHDIGERQLKEIESFRNQTYEKFLTSEDIDIKDVMNVLPELSKNYAMCIVTTTPRNHFNLIHKERSIVQYMEFVLTLSDYNRAKPWPDPYLKALETFDATPNEAIVIEDTSRGLQAAVKAGIDCVIVKNEFTSKQDFSEAYAVLNSIDELPEFLTNERDK